jgi:hypothetical protein
MAWLNADGLYVKTGYEKAAAGNPAGEYKTLGRLRDIEVRVSLATLGTARSILSDVTYFPKGARIEEVEVVVETAATGTNAVLNLGLVRTDRTTTYDDDGFVAALAVTSMDAAGEKVVLRPGVTGAGAFIGTTLANVGLLVADYDTAAFETGVIRVRIRYYAP